MLTPRFCGPVGKRMAVLPISTHVAQLALAPFEPRHAELVAAWIVDAAEAFSIAPRTAPPITPQRVREWGGPGCSQWLLTDAAGGPLAYGELNELTAGKREFWLGHILVPSAQRGRGLGRELVRRLLLRAFESYDARRVSLVVFTDNAAAIACYRAAGFYPDGFESHFFEAYNRSERLLRMACVEM
jgi:RimJ/RimL family protein N-acetyltransferase